MHGRWRVLVARSRPFEKVDRPLRRGDGVEKLRAECFAAIEYGIAVSVQRSGQSVRGPKGRKVLSPAQRARLLVPNKGGSSKGCDNLLTLCSLRTSRAPTGRRNLSYQRTQPFGLG